jgi:5S rRNA maturation endonuclease (ribonuclease M5)
MLEHYGVVADPARVGDSNRKGTVENAVKHAQNTALKGRKFDRLEAQNEWLMHWESRWASQRIHGRSKRQVEAMFQEEKPFLAELPLMPFRYFEQETRTVYDDGTIQVGRSYYAANPALIGSEVTVRIFDNEIQILDPRRMEVIRRHPKSKRAGSLMMEPGDRIFNPSRETDRLLSQAEAIGPHTFSLCEKWFTEEGRCGQRRMYGLVNLVRHYPACYIEKAALLAKENGLRSSKALRRMVESMAAEAQDRKAKRSDELTQDHPLIRSGEDYAAFWDQHAVQAPSPAGPVPIKISSSRPPVISRVDFSQIWQQASWVKVIEVFGLMVDDKRRSRDDEIWVKSPFTAESRASMHLSLSANVYKDFSSGKGGGIMQFCREMWRRQGREMSMFAVAQWMISAGISMAQTDEKRQIRKAEPPAANQANRAIEVDLRPFLRSDHPEWGRRGISAQTCRYLGCGFLPHRAGANGVSPLNSRLVFQIRGLRENGASVQPIILSHSGRALSPEQEDRDGKYWSYPFRKGLEVYNQDKLLLDEEARRQANVFGLVLVEGFFDVAKLVEAGCRNAGALMGSHIAAGQIDRLEWLRSRIGFSRIVLFLDRDRAGREGARNAADRLRGHNFEVSVFDWDLSMSWNSHSPGPLPNSIADPADMPVEQLCSLRQRGII